MVNQSVLNEVQNRTKHIGIPCARPDAFQLARAMCVSATQFQEGNWVTQEVEKLYNQDSKLPKSDASKHY